MSKRDEAEAAINYPLMCLGCGEYEHLNNIHIIKNKYLSSYGNTQYKILYSCRVCRTINEANTRFINILKRGWIQIMYNVHDNITEYINLDIDINHPERVVKKPGFINLKRFKKLLLFS